LSVTAIVSFLKGTADVTSGILGFDGALGAALPPTTGGFIAATGADGALDAGGTGDAGFLPTIGLVPTGLPGSAGLTEVCEVGSAFKVTRMVSCLSGTADVTSGTLGLLPVRKADDCGDVS
jgi:hypothetical protein